jgi:hypothetical protein
MIPILLAVLLVVIAWYLCNTNTCVAKAMTNKNTDTTAFDACHTNYPSVPTEDLGLYSPEHITHKEYILPQSNPGFQGRDGSSMSFEGAAAPEDYAPAMSKYVSIDDKSTIFARQRARDKRVIDAHVTKDMDFYKYHYGNELDESENKVWWGQYEY